MSYINEATVMQFYIEQIDADNIVFLQGRDALKADIRGRVKALMDARTMNEKIQVAAGLWKRLFEAAMSYISPDKRGYDKIFGFFDAYVEFEELIFASDSFYRDHTLHCIWVYFLGEYVARKPEFSIIFEDMKRDELMLRGVHEIIPNSGAFKRISTVVTKVAQMEEAVRCISSLTHDLGYPLKKIEKINKSIKKVLPYFAVTSFNDFNFEYGNIQQEFIAGFVDFISRSMDINLSVDEASADDATVIKHFYEIISKCVNINQYGTADNLNEDAIAALSDEDRAFIAKHARIETIFGIDEACKNGYLNDFENYQHGIMSAFLLMKNLEAFKEINYIKSKDLLPMTDDTRYPASRTLVLQEILQSVAFHTCDSRKISDIDSVNYLTLIDELEEFSRISRASQNREYVKEFCETSIDMSEDGWLNIDFTFNNGNLDNLNPEISFKGRCKRFLTLFDIPELSSALKLRVRVIGDLATDHNTYMLEIARNHAVISINGESKDIPKYLKSEQFFTSEEYAKMGQ